MTPRQLHNLKTCWQPPLPTHSSTHHRHHRQPTTTPQPEDEIISEVDKGCRQVLLKPDAPPPKVLGLKIWPTAIPQYELGHLELIADLEKAEAEVPGLWVCGNYRSGVAFPDCVTFGYEHAKEVQVSP